MTPAIVKMRNGSLLVLFTARAEYVSSANASTTAYDVFFTICTKNPIVGGVAICTAWGKMMSHQISKRLKARPSAASHCVLGTARTQPFHISARNTAE